MLEGVGLSHSPEMIKPNQFKVAGVVAFLSSGECTFRWWTARPTSYHCSFLDKIIRNKKRSPGSI